MKISPILNSQINFKSGKTSIYSDFDGSYMPFSHNDVCNNNFISTNESTKKIFNNIFDKFATFFAKGSTDLDFTITTGRNKFEYDFFVKKIKEQNLHYLSPTKLITRDGTDFYFINSSGYEKNSKRIKQISLESNWDRAKIEPDLKKILQKEFANVFILNTPINKCEYDYEDLSLESKLKSFKNEDKAYYASFAHDEDLFIEIALSERLDITKIKSLFENYLDKNNIKAKVSAYESDKNTYLPQYSDLKECMFKPARLIKIVPTINDVKISKLNDVKKEVEYNVLNQTNNLTIAIGDGINDEKMLNPTNYLSVYGLDVGSNFDEILKNEAALNALKKLPFMSIIVGTGANLEHLRKFGEKLEQNGIKKIFTVEKPLNGFVNELKQSICAYGEENEDFKYSMSIDLFKEILEKEGANVY